MSNNRIFAGSRYEPQGRNVNLTGTMYKRAPIFTHTTPDKPQTSPFANYACKTSESFLNESQASTEDRVNPDVLRQLIKEELLKNQNPAEQTNRKLIHTLQAQLTDLKERISEYEKENNQKLQVATLGIKEEFRGEVDKMGKEVQMEISTKLRSFYQKANVELKKDILKIVQDQFFTLSEGEDLQSKFQGISERIESLNFLISTNKLSPKQPSNAGQNTVAVEMVEGKLAKLQKQLQHNKKQTSDLHSRLKCLQQWKHDQNSQRSIKQLQQKVDLLRQKNKHIEQQLQKRLGNFEIKLTGTEQDVSNLKQKITDLLKNSQEQRTLFLDLNRKISSRPEETDLATSIMLNNSSIAQQQIKQILDDNSVRCSIEILDTPKAEGIRQQTRKKSLYQVDSDGYLMDENRKYLLTEAGATIKLNQQQIDALFKSNVVEIVDN